MMMDLSQIRIVIQLLKKRGVAFDKGLSDAEFSEIHSGFNVIFPPDLKLFLQIGLPISKGFVNWRSALCNMEEKEKINKSLNWPLEGLLFDVQNNVFWKNEWGECPVSFEEQKQIVLKRYQEYPAMVPIYFHRYIPVFSNEEDNPVFSIYQSDIVYYGNNLADYLHQEFFIKLPENIKVPLKPKYITFWSSFIEEY